MYVYRTWHIMYFVHFNTQRHTDRLTDTLTQTYTQSHTCMRALTGTHTQTHMHTHTYTHTHTHMHTSTHTHTSTYTHTTLELNKTTTYKKWYYQNAFNPSSWNIILMACHMPLYLDTVSCYINKPFLINHVIDS